MAIWTVFLLFGLLLVTEGNIVKSHNVKTICPDEWSALGYKCFKFFKYQAEWADAEVHCLKNGGNLASVHSYEENLLIQKLIKQATGSNIRAWIGGSDSVKEGTWLWSDGLKMDFNDWGLTQPSNYLGKENCIEINYSSSLQWNDDDCSIQKSFVCVKK